MTGGIFFSIKSAALAACIFACFGVSGCGDSPVSGATWRLFALKNQFVHRVAVVPGPGGVIYAATEHGLYRRVGGRWSHELRGQALWDVVTAAGGREVVAAGNSGLVFVSLDGGRRWHRHALASLGAYSVTVRPGDARWIVAGVAGGIFVSKDGGRTWRRTASLRGSAASAFAWTARSNRALVAGTVAGGTGKSAPSALVSHNAGVSWASFGTGLPAAGVMSLESLPSGAVLAGTMGHAVWRRGSEAAGWIRRSSGMPRTDDHNTAIVALPKSNALYVSTLANGVFRSSSGGGAWTAVSSGLPRYGGNQLVLSLADDAKTGSLLAGTPSGIYRLRLSSKGTQGGDG